MAIVLLINASITIHTSQVLCILVNQSHALLECKGKNRLGFCINDDCDMVGDEGTI